MMGIRANQWNICLIQTWCFGNCSHVDGFKRKEYRPHWYIYIQPTKLGDIDLSWSHNAISNAPDHPDIQILAADLFFCNDTEWWNVFIVFLVRPKHLPRALFYVILLSGRASTLSHTKMRCWIWVRRGLLGCPWFVFVAFFECLCNNVESVLRMCFFRTGFS